MIYLLYGSDTEKARGKLRALINGMIEKKPDATHLKMTDETFDEALLSEAMGSIGLFNSKIIVEMDMVFRNKVAKESVFDRLKEIAESESIFVFLEGALTKADLGKFERLAEKTQEYELRDPVKKSAQEFNIFSLTDALGERNKKKLWVLYQKALRAGKEAEEVHGILFWQLKAMALVEGSRDVKETGLSPFVYQKSKRFLSSFAPGELQAMVTKFIELYHDSRRGEQELPDALERFILSF